MFKVLTMRTLNEVVNGGPSFWRLSNPLRQTFGLRGSILLATSNDYLRRRTDRVMHWSPFDTGGIANGFLRLPGEMERTSILFRSASLETLCALGAEHQDVRSALEVGHPLPDWALYRVMPGQVAIQLGGMPRDSWMYEIRLDVNAPIRADEVLTAVVPRIRSESLRSFLSIIRNADVIEYNPRWGLDSAGINSMRWGI